jgi:hypothetical protein
LEEIARDNAEFEDDDIEIDNTQSRAVSSNMPENIGPDHSTVPSSFVLGEQIDISPRSAQNSNNQEMPHDSGLTRTSVEGRRSHQSRRRRSVEGRSVSVCCLVNVVFTQSR